MNGHHKKPIPTTIPSKVHNLSSELRERLPRKKCWAFTTYVKWNHRGLSFPAGSTIWVDAPRQRSSYRDWRMKCIWGWIRKKTSATFTNLQTPDLRLFQEGFSQQNSVLNKVIWRCYNSPKWSQMYQIHQPFLGPISAGWTSYPHPIWGIPFNNIWLMVEQTLPSMLFSDHVLTIRSRIYSNSLLTLSAPFLRRIQHLEKLQKQITIAVTAKTLSFVLSQPNRHFGEEGQRLARHFCQWDPMEGL